jgi:hypothetical protein
MSYLAEGQTHAEKTLMDTLSYPFQPFTILQRTSNCSQPYTI